MKNDIDIQVILDCVKKTARQLSSSVFELHDILKGKEETITGNLQSELSSHFVKELEKDLNNIKSWDGLDLKIETFTKNTENKTGADLGIILRIHKNTMILEKGILVQSKVGDIKIKGSIYAANTDILTQAENMLKFTSDSFFFIYTSKGIKVFSALAVKFNNKNAINSKELYYHDFDSFISEFFKCFVGDQNIKNIFKNPNFLINGFLEEQLQNLIQIELTLNTKEKKK